MKYENQILDAIETIVNKKVETAGYDKTVRAKVLNCDDPTIGKYKVQYQDSIFYAYSGSSEISYMSGSEVYVLIPNNDMSRDKTILGSVSKLGKDYAVTAEGEEAFEIIGSNCVESNNKYELCSYETTNKYVIYDRRNSDNSLRLNLKSIDTYIKASSSIILAATIKTSLPTEQQFRGMYGIVYNLVFTDNGSEELVTREYKLDINHFEGNPYKIFNDKRQVGIFDIDGVNFKYIDKIYLVCYDFPNQASGKNKDIFISNLEIYGSQALSAVDLESCSLSFITPQGVYFDNNDSANATRTIQAQVRVKGKYINPESQRLPYYWFVENNSITSMSEDYNNYGGQGWKCLNRGNIIKAAESGIAPVVEWVPANYTYTIAKKDSEARETKYKCVVIYNNIVLSRIITITNYSSNYNISIISDKGTQFYYDIGNPSLTCLINGQENNNNEYTYQWAEIDNNNNFYSLAETTEMNTEYNNAVTGYNTLKAQISAETAMAAASQSQINNYLTIINKYDKIMRIEGNKIHHLQVSEITNFTNYKCSVYHNGVYIGTASIVINNDLDKKDVYSLVINNGTQTFKYNESGISPASDSLDTPQIILPLSFTIFDNLGNALDEDVIKHCDIKWTVPINNTMLKVSDTYDWISQEDYKILENELSLQYSIRDKYDIKKSNNTIQLVVNYKGMNLVAETDFTFVKEGEPGTNGTEFVCKIVPNTNDTGFGYPMILNGNLNYTPRQNGKWFNVQIWHNGNKIFDSNSSSANTTEGKLATVTWSILKNKYTTSVSDVSSINVTNAGVFSYNSYQGVNSPANIVKATIKYDNMEYYATMPIITATASNGYTVSLMTNTGFRFATYSADGRRPQYDNANPFELKVTKVINNIVEDISVLTQTHSVNYDWYVRGRLYDLVNSVWIDSINLTTYNNITLARNQASYKPLDDFNGECLTNGLECIILNNSATEVARIHIPIHLLLNKYGNAAINSWDGNSVSIDKNGNGVILAPQVGAGQKETDNSFTGMVMGKVKEAGKNKIDVGMFGYNFGERTMFLNAKDGSAIFGKKGPGQIILDPAAAQAMLYSSSYWKNYNDDGKPSSYNRANKNNSGMLIDLTTPLIEWGNGNFAVDENGHLTAKGGGAIAGFNIDDDSLFTGTKTANDNIRLSSTNGTFSRTINGTLRNDLNLAINNKFAVDKNGNLYSSGGQIAKFNIGTSTLIGGSGNNTVGMCAQTGDEWAFWAGAEVGENAPFHVGHSGSLYASNADITGKITATSGSFTGTIEASGGHIGGWIINNNELTSNNGNIHIEASGTLRGPNWSISSSGHALFSDVQVANWNSSLGATDKLLDFGNFYVQKNGYMHASSGSVSGSLVSSGINASNITAGRLNITSGGYYLRMGFSEGNNPSVSGLNVGGYGIKAYSGISANSFSITDSDTGKGASFQVPRQGGGWYYITFTGGILTAYERHDS